MNNARETGRTKRADRRMWFVAQALNRGLTPNANLANAWYISEGTDDAARDLERFATWLGENEVADHEP